MFYILKYFINRKTVYTFIKIKRINIFTDRTWITSYSDNAQPWLCANVSLVSHTQQDANTLQSFLKSREKLSQQWKYLFILDFSNFSFREADLNFKHVLVHQKLTCNLENSFIEILCEYILYDIVFYIFIYYLQYGLRPIIHNMLILIKIYE